MANAAPQLRFDRLLALPKGTVIDAIPPDQRYKYYLRGASLGALALNLARGIDRINPQDDLYMHVAHESGDHSYARSHAEMLTRGTYPGHFEHGDIEDLSQLTGSKVDAAPGIVLGIPRDQNQLVLHPRTNYPVVGHRVTFGGIDPHSQEALTDLFGVDVANLRDLPVLIGPRDPNASGPVDIF